jgi:ABC-type transport system involved in multi-copper enzyme maturation permease subunit
MKVAAIALVVWLDAMRRKDAYVFLVLLAGLLVALGSVDLFGLGGVAVYVLDIGLLSCWLFGWILAINAGCRELPQEESRGTVYMLLAKPVSRLELIAGKWLGAWSGVVTAVLFFYIAAALLALARGAAFNAYVLFQAWLLHAVALAILTALGLVVSTRLNRDAATTLAAVLSGTAFLLVPRIPELALYSAPWAQSPLIALYFALPHLELFDLRQQVVHGLPGLDAWTLLALVAYGLTCAAALVLVAWLAYRNKRFDRTALSE